MKSVFLLTIVSTMVVSTSSWLFWRRYPSARANKKPIDHRCEAAAAQGSCQFYSCFEQRLPCGKNWYNTKYGAPYCKDFIAFAHKFSPKGQQFINDTRVCMGQELVSWYRKDILSCHDYTHAAFKALSRCYIRHGFCDVVHSDADHLVNIYRPEHLFQRGALKIWREMVRMAYQCEPEYFREVLALLLNAFKDFSNY